MKKLKGFFLELVVLGIPATLFGAIALWPNVVPAILFGIYFIGLSYVLGREIQR